MKTGTRRLRRGDGIDIQRKVHCLEVQLIKYLGEKMKKNNEKNEKMKNKYIQWKAPCLEVHSSNIWGK